MIHGCTDGRAGFDLWTVLHTTTDPHAPPHPPSPPLQPHSLTQAPLHPSPSPPSPPLAPALRHRCTPPTLRPPPPLHPHSGTAACTSPPLVLSGTAACTSPPLHPQVPYAFSRGCRGAAAPRTLTEWPAATPPPGDARATATLTRMHADDHPLPPPSLPPPPCFPPLTHPDLRPPRPSKTILNSSNGSGSMPRHPTFTPSHPTLMPTFTPGPPGGQPTLMPSHPTFRPGPPGGQPCWRSLPALCPACT